jgi:hypothetical protein
MSECLMAQRGGKYTRGRTITDDNVTPVHFLFEQIWSADLSKNFFCSIDTDDQGNLYVSSPMGGITKLSETDGSQIWANNSSYNNMQNRAVVDKSGDIYAVYYPSFPNAGGPAQCIRKLSGIDGREIWDKDEYASNVIADNTGDIYVSHYSEVKKLSGIDGREIWDIDFPYDVYDMGVDNSGDIILLGDTVAKLSNVDKTIIWNSGPIGAYDLAIGKNNIYATTDEGIKILSDVDGHIISTINKYRGQRFLLSDDADDLYIFRDRSPYGDVNVDADVVVDKISTINNKKYGTYVAANADKNQGSYGLTIYNDYIYIVVDISSQYFDGDITIVSKCYRKNIYTIVS